MRVCIILVLFFLLAGCSNAKTYYENRDINGVKVCELNIVDTGDLIGLKIINRTITPETILNLYEDTQTRWLNQTATVSRCSEQHPLHGSKALQLNISQEKWADGFQFAYELYFDEDNKLALIEAEHRYIDGKWP